MVYVTLGGGCVNTEQEGPVIFDCVSLDSGFLPLKRLVEWLELIGTFSRKNDAVVFQSVEAEEVNHPDLPPSDFTGLELDDYFGVFETLNPVTWLWSDDR